MIKLEISDKIMAQRVMIFLRTLSLFTYNTDSPVSVIWSNGNESLSMTI